MRQQEMQLTKEDRQTLEAFRSSGCHAAREINRAHILAALDGKLPESQIRDVLGIGRTIIWRTRLAYLKGGLQYALFDKARPGKPRILDAAAEAKIIELARSTPPAGAKRWTLCTLEQAVHTKHGAVSRETIRRLLKKIGLKLEAQGK